MTVHDDPAPLPPEVSTTRKDGAEQFLANARSIVGAALLVDGITVTTPVRDRITARILARLIRAIREQIADEITAEADDHDPDQHIGADPDQRIPGAAGNAYWRAMCRVEGLRTAVSIARGDQ